jgi:hypothetical protein
MGNVVNLNRFKKRREREATAKQADANRARFGRTKSDRIQEQERKTRAKQLLDQHRLEDEDKA